MPAFPYFGGNSVPSLALEHTSSELRDLLKSSRDRHSWAEQILDYCTFHSHPVTVGFVVLLPIVTQINQFFSVSLCMCVYIYSIILLL